MTPKWRDGVNRGYAELWAYKKHWASLPLVCAAIVALTLIGIIVLVAREGAEAGVYVLAGLALFFWPPLIWYCGVVVFTILAVIEAALQVLLGVNQWTGNSADEERVTRRVHRLIVNAVDTLPIDTTGLDVDKVTSFTIIVLKAYGRYLDARQDHTWLDEDIAEHIGGRTIRQDIRNHNLKVIEEGKQAHCIPRMFSGFFVKELLKPPALENNRLLSTDT